jgi:anti-anti-sigma regulatory factor
MSCHKKQSLSPTVAALYSAAFALPAYNKVVEAAGAPDSAPSISSRVSTYQEDRLSSTNFSGLGDQERYDIEIGQVSIVYPINDTMQLTVDSAYLLLVIAWNMADVKHFIRTLRVAPKNDVLVLITCFTLTVLFDMTIAVGVGISLAALLFVHKSMDSAESILMRKERHNFENLPNEVAVYDINGPLFFGTAQKALKNLTDITPEVSVVVLDMSEVTMIDLSAIVAMESIVDNLSKNNVSLVITNLRPHMIAKLNRVGIQEKKDEVLFSNNLTDALKKASELT